MARTWHWITEPCLLLSHSLPGNVRSPGSSPVFISSGLCLGKVVLIATYCSSMALSCKGAGICILWLCRKCLSIWAQEKEQQSQQSLRKDDTASGTELNPSPILPSVLCSLPVFKAREPNCSAFQFPLLRQNLKPGCFSCTNETQNLWALRSMQD